MTIDPGLATVGAALIAIVAVAVGASVQFVLDRKRMEQAELRQDERDRKTRLRAHDLQRIDHTRRDAERLRLQVIAMRSGEAVVASLGDQLERSDFRLIGDRGALDALFRATQAIAKGCEEELKRAGRVTPRILTDKEQQALSDARLLVLDALEVQERRALGDEPLLTLPPQRSLTREA